MYRFFSIIILFLALTSCEDQVKFNNPAVQALKDNEPWRATLFNATQAPDGSLTIQAVQTNEVLTLKTASATVDTYILGVDDVNKVSLEKKEGDVITVFSTDENIGNGQIVITELDAVNHTVTGEFTFNAINESLDPSVKKYVNFQKGVFYKVPVTKGSK